MSKLFTLLYVLGLLGACAKGGNTPAPAPAGDNVETYGFLNSPLEKRILLGSFKKIESRGEAAEFLIAPNPTYETTGEIDPDIDTNLLCWKKDALKNLLGNKDSTPVPLHSSIKTLARKQRANESDEETCYTFTSNEKPNIILDLEQARFDSKELLHHFEGKLEDDPEIKEKLLNLWQSQSSLREKVWAIQNFWIQEVSYDKKSPAIMLKFFEENPNANMYSALCSIKKGNCQPINLALGASIAWLSHGEVPVRFSKVLWIPTGGKNVPITSDNLHLQVEVGLPHPTRPYWQWEIAEASVSKATLSDAPMEDAKFFIEKMREVQKLQLNLAPSSLQFISKADFASKDHSRNLLTLNVSYNAALGPTLPVNYVLARKGNILEAQYNYRDPYQQSHERLSQEFNFSLETLVYSKSFNASFLVGNGYMNSEVLKSYENTNSEQIAYQKVSAHQFLRIQELIIQDRTGKVHKYQERTTFTFAGTQATVSDLHVELDGVAVNPFYQSSL